MSLHENLSHVTCRLIGGLQKSNEHVRRAYGGDDGTRTRGLCRDGLGFRGDCVKSTAPIASLGAQSSLREFLLHPNCTQALPHVRYTFRGVHSQMDLVIRAYAACIFP